MSVPWEGWEITRALTRSSHDRTGRIQQKRDSRSQAEQWVLGRIKHLDLRLYAADSGYLPDKSIIDRLFAEIATSRGALKSWRHNYLLRGLNRGARDLGWPVFDYVPIVKLKLRGSPLNANTYHLLARMRRLRHAFLEYVDNLPPIIDSTSPALSVQVDIGHVLLSVVLFGGVASHRRLKAIALHDASQMGAFADWLWIEWNESPESHSQNWQRWLPDPLSGLLLSCARAQNEGPLITVRKGAKVEREIWLAMQAALDSLRLDTLDRPTSLTMLMKWVDVWMFRHLPPFLAEYATGKLASASLPPHSWRRLLKKRPQPAPAVGNPESIPAASGQSTTYNRSPALPADLEDRARKLRRIMRGYLNPDEKTRSSVRNSQLVRGVLQDFAQQADQPPIVQLLTGWVYARLHAHSQDSTALSVARIQLEAIDRLLLDAVGLDDFLGYEEERQVAIYHSVIDASVSAKRHNVRIAALASFHRHLQHQFGVDAVADELFDGIPEDGGIDANCLSEIEIRAILEALSPAQSRFLRRVALAQQAAFLLSVRGTLRRGEVKQLRLTSIEGVTKPCLVLRERKDETLKSNNAQRIVPLSALLQPDELDIVVAYHQEMVDTLCMARQDPAMKIIAPPSDSDVRLFAREENFGMPMAETSLFLPIEEAMRIVTGDNRIRFHHGRHTAIAHILIRLVGDTLPDAASILDIPSSPGDQSTLQAKLIGHDSPNRQHLWTTAIIAGHATPEITIGSYFHLCDWLLWHATQAYQGDILTINRAANILSVPCDIVHRLTKRLGVSPRSVFAIPLHKNKTFSAVWSPYREIEKSPPLSSSTSSAADTPGPMPLRFVTPIGDTLNAVVVLRLLDEMDTVMCLPKKKAGSKTKHKSPKDTVAGISHRFNIAQADAYRLWGLVEKLDRIVGRSPRRSSAMTGNPEAIHGIPMAGYTIDRPLPRMRPVRSTSEANLTNQLFAKLQRMLSEHPDTMAEWTALHWRHLDVESHTLRFGNRNAAQTWLQTTLTLIQELHAGGNSQESPFLNFAHRANGRGSAPPAIDQKAQWCRDLNVAPGLLSVGPLLIRPKGDEGLGFLDISFSYPQQATRAWRVQRAGRDIKERPRKSSVALDAAAYVLTLLLLS